jgi:uridylate kinase
MSDIVVISLGGSLIAQDSIGLKFLSGFKNLVLKHKNKKFIIVCGGGKPARLYQDAARTVSGARDRDLDMIGILATRLNGELLRGIFGKDAHPKVLYYPKDVRKTKQRIIIGAGSRPGSTTDLMAVQFAAANKAKMVTNLTNTEYVYDRHPKLKGAKPIKKISWCEFNAKFHNDRKPGMHFPFDPVASKMAERLKIKVMIAGPNVPNFEKILSGKPFKGTLIQ